MSVSPLRLDVPGRSLLLVAGMPGVGKSTLLRSLPPRPDVVVLDSDTHRAQWRARLPRVSSRWCSPLVHLSHRAAVLRAICSPVRCVLVHLPATAAWHRAVLVATSRALGRRPHLFMLHTDPAAAWAGQAARGRIVSRWSFRGHARRGARLAARLRSGRVGWVDRGWTQVTVGDRTMVAGGLVLDPPPPPDGAARRRRTLLPARPDAQ